MEKQKIRQRNERLESWKIRFGTDRYHALYQMGFEQKMDNLTASGSFLHLLSDVFFKRLTSLPELELVREKVKLLPCLNRAAEVSELVKALWRVGKCSIRCG